MSCGGGGGGWATPRLTDLETVLTPLESLDDPTQAAPVTVQTVQAPVNGAVMRVVSFPDPNGAGASAAVWWVPMFNEHWNPTGLGGANIDFTIQYFSDVAPIGGNDDIDWRMSLQHVPGSTVAPFATLDVALGGLATLGTQVPPTAWDLKTMNIRKSYQIPSGLPADEEGGFFVKLKRFASGDTFPNPVHLLALVFEIKLYPYDNDN